MTSIKIFKQQFKALFYRNILIKVRSYRHTLLELILPLIIVGQQSSIQAFLQSPAKQQNIFSSIISSYDSYKTDKKSEYLHILNFQCDQSEQYVKRGGQEESLEHNYVSPVSLVSSFSPIIDVLVINLVSEKESGLKALMKIMGLKTSVYWSSWFVVYALFILIVSLILIICVKVIEAFVYTSLVDLFMILLFYGLSMITFSFLMSTFLSNSRTAGAFSSLITIGMSFLSHNTSTDTANLGFYNLLAPVVFTTTMNKIVACERLSTTQRIIQNDCGTFLQRMITTLFLDMVLYFVLALYWEQPYGEVPSKSSWRFFKKKVVTESEEDVSSDAVSEEIPEQLLAKKKIRISKLKKIYPGLKRKDDVNALNGLDLDMLEDQITVLLGVNGAGKTTLMHILCGFLYPSSGTAHIHDLDIKKPDEMKQIHSMLGVCFQNDVHIEILTPAEQLNIFGTIKGVPYEKITQKVFEVLNDVGLQEKANDIVETLSGGQKRRLSVALALIGDPKILILDEPTSGCDPVSRRHLWSVLEKLRPGKITLLSTHTMEEAEILGDRVAIISKGRLRSVGSPLFLKHKFGVGYHLKFTLQEAFNDKLTTLVQSHIPTITVESIQGQEVDYLLPSQESAKFISLFNDLDQNLKSSALGIDSYHISATTLEEVFIKLQQEEAEADEGVKLASAISSKLIEKNSENEPFLRNIPLEKNTFQKFRAMTLLRFRQKWREKTAHIATMVISLQLILSSCVLIFVASLFKLAKENPEMDLLKTFKLFDADIDIDLDSPNTLLELLPRLYQCGVMGCFTLGLAFAILSPSNVVEVVRDRQAQIRSQLKVFSLPFSCYWFPYCLVHCLNFSLNTTIFLGFLYGIFGDSYAIFYALVLLIYIPTALLACYAVSFYFQKSQTAQSVSSLFLVSISILPFVYVAYTDRSNHYDALWWHFIFTGFNPWYSLIGISYFVFVDPYTTLWDVNVCKTIILMIINSIGTVYFLHKWDTESNKTQAWTTKIESQDKYGDDDVNMEKNKVESECFAEIPLILTKNLFKAFKSSAVSNTSVPAYKLAVDNLCIAIKSGEIFGLLGPNGAGKTTTLQILTANDSATKGQVQICGHSLDTDSLNALRNVGYCPQVNALWASITLEEHLQCYAAIKGIAKKHIPQLIERIMEVLNIKQHARKTTLMLSGGTRRKLSYALSLLGNPKVLLLDEPSSGMDPWSRRFFWNTILAGLSDKRAILLTTHSMEEAEALCSRIGILSRGTLRCLGSVQHLKNKYGQQYQLDLRLDDSSYLKDVTTFVSELFPNAVQKEQTPGRLRCLIPRSDHQPLAKVFTSLEEAKIKFKVRDYTFEQTSLEQVFHFITEEDD